MLVARKPFLFFGIQYAPGDEVKDDFNPYQRETFVRSGFVDVVPDKPKRKAKTVSEAVEV